MRNMIQYWCSRHQETDAHAAVPTGWTLGGAAEMRDAPERSENNSKGSLPVLDEAGSVFRLRGDVALLIEEFLYEK